MRRCLVLSMAHIYPPNRLSNMSQLNDDSDAVSKTKQRTDSAKRWAAPYVAKADESIIGRLYNRLLEVEFIDRAVALAAKAFIAFFPFLLAFMAVVPEDIRLSIVSTLQSRFGLDSSSSESVRSAFATAGDMKAATGIFGLVFLFFYATSFTTALQRLYIRVWRRPPGGGIKNQGRGIAWLAGVLMLLAINGFIGRLLVGAPGSVIRFGLAAVGGAGLWWWTSHTMLRGDVRWRPLLPGALLTGLGIIAYGWLASFWMPMTVQSNEAQFGYFGMSLSLVSWFVGIAFVLIVAAAAGPTLAEGHGRFARWLRGPDDDVLVPGAKPPLPGPTRQMRFSDALAIEPK